jgi:hypothetical protein
VNKRSSLGDFVSLPSLSPVDIIDLWNLVHRFGPFVFRSRPDGDLAILYYWIKILS